MSTIIKSHMSLHELCESIRDSQDGILNDSIRILHGAEYSPLKVAENLSLIHI